MITAAQNRIISQIFDMLESLDQKDFDEADVYIEVKLKDRYGDYTISFSDEMGVWAYEIERNE